MTPWIGVGYGDGMPSASSINVSLTPELRAWIVTQIASGRYRSASEVVRNALRHLQVAETPSLAKKPDISKATTG